MLLLLCVSMGVGAKGAVCVGGWLAFVASIMPTRCAWEWGLVKCGGWWEWG